MADNKKVQIIPKTVVGRMTQEAYADKYYAIKIYLNGDWEKPAVVGYLTSPLTNNMAASWETIINMDGRFSLAQDILGVMGAKMFNTGAWTEKFYKGGSYFSIAPTFRVVDKDGDGSVLYAAKKLLAFTAPPGPDDSSQTITQAIDQAIEKAKKFLNSNPKDNETDTTTPTPAISNKIVGQIKDAAKSIMNWHPPLCSVTIGTFLKLSTAIVTDVNTTYSKELTKNGYPLFGDFTVTFSTKRIARIGTIENIFQGGNSGRVESK